VAASATLGGENPTPGGEQRPAQSGRDRPMRDDRSPLGRDGPSSSAHLRLFQRYRPASDVATDPARCPRRVTTGLLPQFGYRRFSTIRVRSRTRPTCSRPQSLTRQGFCGSVLNQRSPELQRRGAKQRTFCRQTGQRQSRGLGRNPWRSRASQPFSQRQRQLCWAVLAEGEELGSNLLHRGAPVPWKLTHWRLPKRLPQQAA
jgi:hypothetical protein